MPKIKYAGYLKLLVFDIPEFELGDNKFRIISTATDGRHVFHTIKNLKTKEFTTIEQQQMHGWKFKEIPLPAKKKRK